MERQVNNPILCFKKVANAMQLVKCQFECHLNINLEIALSLAFCQIANVFVKQNVNQ